MGQRRNKNIPRLMWKGNSNKTKPLRWSKSNNNGKTLALNTYIKIKQKELNDLVMDIRKCERTANQT